jgi:DNA-binding beta-propeller fold protein YncE
VVNPGSGDISVIDPVSAKVVATVPVGGSLELGVADGRGRMFVNVEDKKQLVILDTRARKVVRRVALADCGGPTGIASDPASREVVSACGGGNVAIVSRVDGSRVASLPIGNGADGAAFDPIRHLALVPAGKSGNVRSFDWEQGRRWSRRSRLQSARGRSRSMPRPGGPTCPRRAFRLRSGTSGPSRNRAPSGCWWSALRS